VTTIDAPGFATVHMKPFTGRAEALGWSATPTRHCRTRTTPTSSNTLADQSGAVFDTAGSLRGGRQVFITMKLPETLTVGGIDSIDLNIAALNSHDGTSSSKILITPVRVVCANTQAAAIGNHVSSIAIRHTRNAKATVQIARETLGLSFAYCAAFQAEAEQLIQTAMTASEFQALTRRIFGDAPNDATKRTRDADRQRQTRLAPLFHNADTQANIRGTAWAGYQAVVEYLDHHAPVRDSRNAATARATRLLTSDERAKTKRATWFPTVARAVVAVLAEARAALAKINAAGT